MFLTCRPCLQEPQVTHSWFLSTWWTASRTGPSALRDDLPHPAQKAGARLSANHLSCSRDPARMHEQASQASEGCVSAACILGVSVPELPSTLHGDRVQQTSLASCPACHLACPGSWHFRAGSAHSPGSLDLGQLRPTHSTCHHLASVYDAWLLEMTIPSLSGQKQQNTQLHLNSWRAVPLCRGQASSRLPPYPPPTPCSATASSQSLRDTDLWL